MSEWNYDMPWRPNFEAVEIGGWVLGMAATSAVHLATNLPALPFYMSMAVMAGFALRRLPSALHLHRVRQGLKAQPAKLLGQDELIGRMQAKQGSLYLGEGYSWTQTEGQQIFELMKRDVTKIMPPVPEGFMGAPWIHGISQQEDTPQGIPSNLASLHTLIVGTTGSGKTRLFDLLISQAILRGEPVIILDPKGDKELADNARRACELAGHPHKFKYFHPAFPEKSVRISPTKNFGRATEVAARIAALMRSEGGDPFQAFAMMALNNVIQAMLICGTLPTLVELRRALEGGLEGLIVRAISTYGRTVLNAEFDNISKTYLSKAATEPQRAIALIKLYRTEIVPVAPSSDLEGVLAMFEHDKAHFGKMIASLIPVLNMLTSGHIGPLLSPLDDPNDTREITDANKVIRAGEVLYMGLDSLSDAMVGSAIGSIFLADLAAVAGERYNFGGEGLKQVNIFVDEAAETVNDQLVQLLNKGRGAGIHKPEVKPVVASERIEPVLTMDLSAFASTEFKFDEEPIIAQDLTDIDIPSFADDGSGSFFGETGKKTKKPADGFDTVEKPTVFELPPEFSVNGFDFGQQQEDNALDEINLQHEVAMFDLAKAAVESSFPSVGSSEVVGEDQPVESPIQLVNQAPAPMWPADELDGKQLSSSCTDEPFGEIVLSNAVLPKAQNTLQASPSQPKPSSPAKAPAQQEHGSNGHDKVIEDRAQAPAQKHQPKHVGQAKVSKPAFTAGVGIQLVGGASPQPGLVIGPANARVPSVIQPSAVIANTPSQPPKRKRKKKKSAAPVIADNSANGKQLSTIEPATECAAEVVDQRSNGKALSPRAAEFEEYLARTPVLSEKLRHLASGMGVTNFQNYAFIRFSLNGFTESDVGDLDKAGWLLWDILNPGKKIHNVFGEKGVVLSG